jgi:hypothetical protein
MRTRDANRGHLPKKPLSGSTTLYDTTVAETRRYTEWARPKRPSPQGWPMDSITGVGITEVYQDPSYKKIMACFCLCTVPVTLRAIYLSPAHTNQSYRLHTSLQPPAESRAKRVQAVESNDAQGNRDRLLQSDSPRDGGTAEDDGGKKTELDAVRLVVLDAVTAEGICNGC